VEDVAGEFGSAYERDIEESERLFVGVDYGYKWFRVGGHTGEIFIR
jgi:hypothetical protein